MRFNSAEEMYNAVVTENRDLYCVDEERFIFHYNDEEAICEYVIYPKIFDRLYMKAKEHGEYIAAFLGPGGYIYDNGMDYCERYYDNEWKDVTV